MPTTRLHRFTLLFFTAMMLVGVMLCACAATSGGRTAGPVSLAAWDPEPLGPMSTSQEAMGKILAAQIIDRFSQSPRYEVVERENLLKVLEEQHLGSSELADEQTRLRLGRIIGCREMIFGAYQVIGETMRLDIRLVEVSSAKVLKTAVGTAPAAGVGQWIQAADQAATELIGPPPK
jgi:hypothetical protein